MSVSPAFTATGITGATLPSRYAGATASGAPAYGSFAIGDFVIDRSGAQWICTAAGQPGTWTQGQPGGAAGGDLSGTYPNPSVVQGTTSAAGKLQLDGTAADITAAGVQAAGAIGKAADAGHVHPNQAFLSLLTAPAGATAETMPRILAGSSSLNAGTSGILYLTAIGIPAGVAVNNITFVVTGTAKTGGTHGWYVLADSGLVVRAVTADQTDSGTVWGSTNTAYTLPVTATYTTPAAGLYYIGVMVAESGGGVPAFAGNSGAMSAGISAIAPSLAGFSGSGLTTPPAVSSTLAALTVQPNRPMYAYTS